MTWRCNAKHKQKSPRAVPTVAQALIREKVVAQVTVAGVLGNHGEIQGGTPWVLPQGAGEPSNIFSP